MSSTQGLWAQNALYIGPLIAARLRAQVPELREVEVFDELDLKDPRVKQFPAALVLLHEMQPTGSNSLRKVTTADQKWLVILAVTSASADADSRSAKAGPLIPKVVSALQGWEPVRNTGVALAWKPGPRPDYGKDISYFPLLFSIQVISA